MSGTCMQGVIHINDTLLLGPTSLGEFIPVAVKGIHRKRMPVKEVRGGQTASFALKKVRGSVRGEMSTEYALMKTLIVYPQSFPKQKVHTQ